MARTLTSGWLLVTTGLVFAMVFSSCSGGPDLGEADHVEFEAAVQVSASRAGVDLTESDRNCVIEKTSTEQALEILGAFSEGGEGLVLTSLTSDSLATSVVECAGSDVLVQSGLFSFAGDTSAKSQACAGDAFDRELLGELIASFMSGTERRSTEIEIEIGLVLGQCLSPEELLRLHQG